MISLENILAVGISMKILRWISVSQVIPASMFKNNYNTNSIQRTYQTVFWRKIPKIQELGCSNQGPRFVSLSGRSRITSAKYSLTETTKIINTPKHEAILLSIRLRLAFPWPVSCPAIPRIAVWRLRSLLSTQRSLQTVLPCKLLIRVHTIALILRIFFHQAEIMSYSNNP